MYNPTKQQVIEMMDSMSIAEIKELIKKLESKVDHWKSCQDGSYECALSHSGVYDLRDKFRELEKVEK